MFIFYFLGVGPPCLSILCQFWLCEEAQCVYLRLHLGSLLVHFFIGLFVFLEGSHVSSLYILEIRPLSEVSLANIFSHTLGSLLILMLFSLAMKKLFISMRFHLFILSFMSLALGDVSVRMLLHGMS